MLLMGVASGLSSSHGDAVGQDHGGPRASGRQAEHPWPAHLGGDDPADDRGWTVVDILAEYPYLEVEDVRQAVEHSGRRVTTGWGAA